MGNIVFFFSTYSAVCAFFFILGFHQARERQRREEQERKEKEAAEAERKRKEEEEALERAAREAAEKEAALAKRRQEKAMSLGSEPEKGPDVTQVRCNFHH
jgi:FAS-associated factor 2